jgi:hypothetical protein
LSHTSSSRTRSQCCGNVFTARLKMFTATFHSDESRSVTHTMKRTFVSALPNTYEYLLARARVHVSAHRRDPALTLPQGLLLHLTLDPQLHYHLQLGHLPLKLSLRWARLQQLGDILRKLTGRCERRSAILLATKLTTKGAKKSFVTLLQTCMIIS